MFWRNLEVEIGLLEVNMESTGYAPLNPFKEVNNLQEDLDCFREFFDSLVSEISDYNNRSLISDSLVSYTESRRRSFGRECVKILFEKRGSTRYALTQIIEVCDRVLENPYHPQELSDRCSYFKISVEPLLSSVE